MAKRRGLGKGLNELLTSSFGQEEKVKPSKQPKKAEQTKVKPSSKVESKSKEGLAEVVGEKVYNISLEQIKASRFQPRETFDHEALEQLSESIKAQGVIQPIVLRKNTDNDYEIIAGERRFRASKLAGLKEIPAIVRDLSDDAALAVALIENIQREDLNIIEEAKALRRLAEELGFTHLQVAEAVGKSRTSVTNILRLLTLADDVQDLLEHRELEMGHARALLALSKEEQSRLARTIVHKGLSVRETERLVKSQEEKLEQTALQEVDPNIKRLQNDLAETLGAPVKIKHSGGKGALIINYNSIDELEGILAHIS